MIMKTRRICFPLTLLLAACPLEPDVAPTLHICSNSPTSDNGDTDGSSASCVTSLREDRQTMDACDPLEQIAPGEGFFAVHVVDNRIQLPDETKGQLAIETICGEKTFELDYVSAQDKDGNRIAAIPLAAPKEAICGMTVRATLLDQTDACYREVGFPPTGTGTSEASSSSGTDTDAASPDLALECAKLRDACESESANSSGSSTTGAGTGATSGTTGTTDSVMTTTAGSGEMATTTGGDSAATSSSGGSGSGSTSG